MKLQEKLQESAQAIHDKINHRELSEKVRNFVQAIQDGEPGNAQWDDYESIYYDICDSLTLEQEQLHHDFEDCASRIANP